MPIAVMMEIEREHQVDNDDLDDDQEKCGAHPLGLAVFVARLHLAVNFVGRLCDQKQATADQNDVAPGERQVSDGKDGLGKPNQPYQQAEQEDAEQKRERQPDLSGAIGLRLPNSGNDDGQKNYVVDAENDFERRQGQ